MIESGIEEVSELPAEWLDVDLGCLRLQKGLHASPVLQLGVCIVELGDLDKAGDSTVEALDERLIAWIGAGKGDALPASDLQAHHIQFCGFLELSGLLADKHTRGGGVRVAA